MESCVIELEKGETVEDFRGSRLRSDIPFGGDIKRDDAMLVKCSKIRIGPKGEGLVMETAELFVESIDLKAIVEKRSTTGELMRAGFEVRVTGVASAGSPLEPHMVEVRDDEGTVIPFCELWLYLPSKEEITGLLVVEEICPDLARLENEVGLPEGEAMTAPVREDVSHFRDDGTGFACPDCGVRADFEDTQDPRDTSTGDPPGWVLSAVLTCPQCGAVEDWREDPP